MNFIQEYIAYSKQKRDSQNLNRNPRIWLFGEWFGERCNDNCLFLANYVVNNCKEIEVYWVTKVCTDTSLLSNKINVVEMASPKACEVIKIAGVAIMNQSFFDFFDKNINFFNGALTINLWHGIPWKKIGHDCSKYKQNYFFKLYSRMVDSYRNADYYISPSEYYSNICQTAFGVKKSQIIRTGLPRNTIFYSEEHLLNTRVKILEQIKEITGIKYTNNINIVLYMPTFRDSADGLFDFESVENINKWLEDNNIVLLQKAHFVNEKRNKKEIILKGKNNSRVVNIENMAAQYLLAASDLLITDYSSCFFDYLILNRPIIHFLYDYDYYLNDDRGLYCEKEEVVSGDVAFELKELQDFIKENLMNPSRNAEIRKKRKEKFINYENEKSCEEIIKFINNKLNICK